MSAAPQKNTPDVTPQGDAAKAPPAKSPIGKILLLVTLLNAVMIGGAVAAFFVLRPGEGSEKPKKAAKAEEHEAAEAPPAGTAAEEAAPPPAAGEGGKEAAAQPAPMVKVDNVTVRLRNLEVDRYARATFELETLPTANIAKIQNNQPKLRDAILTLLADRAYEDLAGSAGMSKLKADIMVKAVQIFGERQVAGVYVSEFILQ